jgi:hypothetical protein
LQQWSPVIRWLVGQKLKITDAHSKSKGVGAESQPQDEREHGLPHNKSAESAIIAPQRILQPAQWISQECAQQ